MYYAEFWAEGPVVRLLSRVFKSAERPEGARPPGRLKLFVRDVRGVAALEFGFIAPPFFLLLFAMFEVGLTYTADAVLQNAVNETARMIRTGQVDSQDMTREEFYDEVCDRIDVLLTCDQRLQIDVRRFTAFSGAGFTNPLDANGNFRNDYRYEPGAPCDVILVRAFYEWEPVTPGLGPAMMGLGGAMKNMGSDGNGQATGRLLQGTAAIRNEPYIVGGPVC